MAESQARQEAAARVLARAVELATAHPDATVEQCLATADMEDRFIYGDPDAPTPRGILNA